MKNQKLEFSDWVRQVIVDLERLSEKYQGSKNPMVFDTMVAYKMGYAPNSTARAILNMDSSANKAIRQQVLGGCPLDPDRPLPPKTKDIFIEIKAKILDVFRQNTDKQLLFTEVCEILRAVTEKDRTSVGRRLRNLTNAGKLLSRLTSNGKVVWWMKEIS